MFKCVYLEGSWETRRNGGFWGNAETSDHTSADGRDLARLIEEACNEFERSGFAIVSVTPKVNGYREFGIQAGAGWAYTAGVIVLARKEDQPIAVASPATAAS